MPESRKRRPRRRRGSADGARPGTTAATSSERGTLPDQDEMPGGRRTAKVTTPNPPWYVPVMVGLMLLGLVWIVVWYVSQNQYPVPGIGSWNLVAGFAIILAGFLMTTRWR